jgi:hypothetical protein
MFEVPVAEWGIPLFGNVGVNAPIKVEFRVKADGSITVMPPRVELGRVKDTSYPGKIGFSYAVGGKFTVDRDFAMSQGLETRVHPMALPRRTARRPRTNRQRHRRRQHGLHISRETPGTIR